MIWMNTPTKATVLAQFGPLRLKIRLELTELP